MASSSLRVLVTAALVLVAGCSCSPVTPGRARDAGPGGGVDGGGTPPTETGAQCIDGLDNDLDGLGDCLDPDCAALADCIGRDAGPRPDVPLEGCAGASFDGENGIAPVDIVWVIDNSGSMGEEAALVQMNINQFAADIVASGVEDYHVILLTQRSFVTVPPPLGTDTERFLHLDVDVQSHDGFQRALEWVMPGTPSGYGHFIRPGSTLHFVFVTDDEAEDITAATFQSMMRSRTGRDFYGHAIASPTTGAPVCPFPGFPCIPAPGCTGPYGDAPAGGHEYELLAMYSGGVFASICTPDWTTIFDALLATIAVPRPLPCNFRIPDPPAGMSFDRNLVNVVYAPSGDAAVDGMTVPRSRDDCASGAGWRYDDPANPTEIILCPSNCAAVEANPSGSVDIQLGCETVVF